MPKAKKNDTKLIKKNSRASVSNTLNEMFFEQKDMTLQAFRMLMFYLAKIDPKKPERTEIMVPLDEYAKMLGVELNERAVDKSTDMLLGYVVKIDPKESDEDSEYEELSHKVQVFSESKLMRRKKDGELLLTFKCHDELKPHIFNLKNQFTAFEVWNILNLNNFQDMRMYMVLSQYRVAGERTVEISELKEMLGISKNAYPEYKVFSRDVLKKCQRSLAARTDICFEFSSVGRPAHSVYFKISPNSDYTILKYLDESVVDSNALPPLEDEADPNQVSLFDQEDPADVERDRRSNLCYGFQDKIFDEFTYDQLVELLSLAQSHVKFEDVKEAGDSENIEYGELRESALASYIQKKILMCNASQKPVNNRYKFIRGAVAGDWR